MLAPPDPFDGAILVDKPAGLTPFPRSRTPPVSGPKKYRGELNRRLLDASGLAPYAESGFISFRSIWAPSQKCY